ASAILARSPDPAYAARHAERDAPRTRRDPKQDLQRTTLLGNEATMSDRKPGIFSRLRTSISSALIDAVDSVSDPGQEVALMLDDLAAQIQSSEGDLKQTIVEKKMLERKLEELKQSEASWQKKAEQALRLGDEHFAREALRKKGDYSMQVKETEA